MNVPRSELILDTARNEVRSETEKLVDKKYISLLEQDVNSLWTQLGDRPNVTTEGVAEALYGAFPDRKIQCIKVLRTIFGLSLRDAKDHIDRVANPWNTLPDYTYRPVSDDLPF